MPQGDAIGGDFDPVPALPIAIDEDVLINAGLGDFQSLDDFGIGQRAGVGRGAHLAPGEAG